MHDPNVKQQPTLDSASAMQYRPLATQQSDKGGNILMSSQKLRVNQTPLHTKGMMMMSEKGGDGGFDFRFDNRSNRSSGRGLAGTGGAGGHSGDENNLLELMVMQNAADAIRQEYIEEPSFRKSMFNEKAEDLAISRGNELPSSATVVMMVVAFVAFGFCTICFKAVYLNYRTTIWEDIYGRGVAFFVCATISYLTQSGTQSIFDLRKTIRAQFLLRVVLISTAYIFLFLAIEWASSFLYVALILCVLPPVCKVVQCFYM